MISPSLGRSRQPIRLTRVDLPEPDGPITASHSPGATLSDTLFSARSSPPEFNAYALVTLRSSITPIRLSVSPQVECGAASPWGQVRLRARYSIRRLSPAAAVQIAAPQKPRSWRAQSNSLPRFQPRTQPVLPQLQSDQPQPQRMRSPPSLTLPEPSLARSRDGGPAPRQSAWLAHTAQR